MHEVRLCVPADCADSAIAAAHAAGIECVTVTRMTIHRTNDARSAMTVSAETSTPHARAFVHTVLRSAWFDRETCSMTTRELRAIVDKGPIEQTTLPMTEPGVDVLQDLWQLSHVTPSYVGRCVASALLMAFAVIDNDLMAMMLAVLFLPFLSELLGAVYGLLRGGAPLVMHAVKALAVTICILLAAGLIVGAANHAPVAYTGFRSLGVSFLISSAIGAAAGLASADDAGRRYLIGVAAAAQLGVFPVYFGIALARGLPPELPVAGHLVTFGVNFVTVAVTAAASYAAVEFGNLRRAK